jgi:signal transduction histidine kinase/CheY-like chemotaxis protein
MPYNDTFIVFLFATFCWIISVQFERIERDAFVRQRDLELARADTENRTAALVLMKENERISADRRNAEKSEFLADAAHDLRNTLHPISNALEAAEIAVQNGNIERSLSSIRIALSAVRHTYASFNATLDLSQIELGMIPVQYSIFDPQTLIDDTVAVFDGLARDYNVKIRHRRRVGEPVAVRSDRQLLGRVLANLVSNAIKYRNVERRDLAAVLVGMVAFPGHVRIDIVDNGLGIPRTRWRDVFKPFVQLNNPNRDRSEGLGLGLSIVNAILPLLEGHNIEMNSTEGKGTRFSVEIPRSHPTLPVTLPSREDAPRHPANLAGCYVLYAEDDLLSRQSIEALFAACGILYESAGTEEELLKLLESLERDPDVVVTDYRLGHKANARVTMEMIREKLGASIPLIVLTGDVDTLENEKWANGSTYVLRKPVPAVALLDSIAAAVFPAEFSIGRRDHYAAARDLNQ